MKTNRFANAIAGRYAYKGKAKKGAGRMPWHQEPKKDVISCEKPWGGAHIPRSTDV